MKRLLFVTAMVCAFAFTIAAQTTGSIFGSVSDPNGANVVGATVSARNNSTGAERSATTNENGTYTFTALQPGAYTVSVESAGFKRTVAPDVKVEVSKEAQVNVTLEIGGAAETVTVTSAQEVVNSTSPSLTNVINTRQVVDLPLGNRNPLELAALQAGIAVVGTDVRGASVGGLRQTAVNLTQDGINAMDNFVKTSSFFAISTPSLNSTAEFSITTGTVGSDAGRGAVQVNLVTKGGTNEYHGGGFLQLVNEWANSSTFFNNYNGIVKPMLRQHYWGFDIGGPMHFFKFGDGDESPFWNGKDKAFFFFSFERFNQTRAASRNRNGVLTQDARNGLFRYPRTCPTAPPDPNCSNGVQTVNLLTLSTVPFNSLNPVMTSHIAQIPLPNNFNCTNSDGFNIGCFSFNVPESTINNKYVGRYDHQIVKDSKFGGHKFEFVYSRVDTETYPDVFTNGVESPFPGGVSAFQYSTRNLFTPALVSTFGSRVTNVLRYGRQWAPVVFDRESPPSAPFISLPGVLINYDNLNMPQPRETIVNQWSDTLSWINGNHLFKFGGDYQKVLTKSYNSAGINQTIQLGTNTANGAGITLASLPGGSNARVTAATTTYAAIVGLLGSSTQTLNVTSPTSGFVPGALRFRDFQAQDVAFFGQDQWRARSNVTLSMGLRWDFLGVPTVPSGLSIQPRYEDIFGISGFGNVFNPTAPAGVPGAVATQNFVSGDTGIALYNDDWNNFAPFAGIAYSPNFKSGPLHYLFGNEGQSSIRAGFSVSFLRDGLTTISNALGTGTTNPGLIQTANQDLVTGSSNLVGQLTPAGVSLRIPSFTIPISDRQNMLANQANGLWAFDPNLRTPYVMQWNIGFEREILKDTAFEIRYQGNRAVKVWRAVDYNEVNIFENDFLQEFLNAQRNLTARGGTNFAPNGVAGLPACAACVPLPILSRFFSGLAGTSTTGFGNTTFISNLNNNNIGTMASTLAFNSAYRANRENPALGIPMNFFVANPNAAFARVLSNDAFSNYHALEIEVRRRFSNGLQFQADYTWSKAMGNAVGAQGNNQSDLVSWRTLRNKQLDYIRSGEDQTQRFVANAVYELPFGKSKAFFSGSNGFVDRLIGGWTIGGITTWSTGVPFFVSSGRTTFNSFNAGNNPAQLLGISLEEFKKNVGLYKTPAGVFFINPELLNITLTPAGKVATSSLKPGLMGTPAPGTFGNFPLNGLNGPSYFNVDLSVTKRIPITERVRFEVKVTAINVLNYSNFIYGTQNFDATNFGVITAQRGTSRNMNVIGQLRF